MVVRETANEGSSCDESSFAWSWKRVIESLVVVGDQLYDRKEAVCGVLTRVDEEHHGDEGAAVDKHGDATILEVNVVVVYCGQRVSGYLGS